MFLEFIGTSDKCINRQCGGGGRFEENETLLVLEYGVFFNNYDDYSYVKIQDDSDATNIYKINKINYYDTNVVIEIEKLTEFQIKCFRDFFTED